MNRVQGKIPPQTYLNLCTQTTTEPFDVVLWGGDTLIPWTLPYSNGFWPEQESPSES